MKYYVDVDSGNTFWYKDAEMTTLHREDGPAVEYANGTKEWYLNGVRHREDGPAYHGANGTKVWYLNGKLHREDGPAYKVANGLNYWYLDDICFTEAEFNARKYQVDGKTVEIDGKKYRLTAI